MLVWRPDPFIEVKHCLGPDQFLGTKIDLVKLNDQCCLCDVIHFQTEYLLTHILDGLALKYVSLIIVALV